MKKITLGKNGPEVSKFGFGLMGMSDFYGSKATRNDEENLATIDLALDSGITFFNTGDFYGVGHNEMLLGKAIKNRRDKFFISVKFGALRGPNGEFLGYDFRPQAIKNFISYSLQRLGTDYIDLYQPARLPHDISIEETISTISDLIKEGKVRYLGLSEANADQIVLAHKVHPVSALEIEYSLATRLAENKIFPTTRELGITVVSYGALSRGLLSGDIPETFEKGDFRNLSPRFSNENFEHNNNLVKELKNIASQKGITPAQLALAWVDAQGDDILTLIATTKRNRLSENLKAQEVVFTDEELKLLDKLFHQNAFVGDRYPAHGMTHVVK